MNRMKGTVILFFGIFCLLNIANGQFNLQIGYNAAYSNPKLNNEILALYNKENNWMSKPLSELHFMHGLFLGARYRFEQIAIALNWRSKTIGLSSEGISPTTNTDYKMELFYRYHTYGLNVETAGTFLSIGASIDYSVMKVKDRITGQKKKIEFMSEDGIGSHFYLNLNLPTFGNMGIALQPYYFVDWTGVNLTKLSERLVNGAISTNNLGKFNHFGISLIFNNGPQVNH